MHPAALIFEEELRRRAIQFAQTLDGRYQIELEGGTLVLNLDNVARDFDRDGDRGRIVRYIESSLAVFAPFPSWADARARIYWSAEASTADLQGALHEPVTDRLSRVLVFADHAGMRWLVPKRLEEWGVRMSEVDAAARENLDRLLHGKRLEVERDDGSALGMVPIDSVALKASIIFAPGLKAFVAEELGWPVLAVIPCRDFIYFFREGDDVIRAIGDVVQREFRESGYPITTEVLRISDAGIESIGHFPE